MKSMIKTVLMNVVGFVVIVAIALLTDKHFVTEASIGITTGSLIAITILYNSIKRYIIGKKEDKRTQLESINELYYQIEGLRMEIEEMKKN